MGITIISGYFDPLHVGHIEYIREALKFNPYHNLWVIVNNDKQCKLKKGKSFMNESERVEIIKYLKNVYRVILSEDTDRTVNETLRMIRKVLPDERIVFFNSGDVKEKCREEETCKKLGIDVIYGQEPKIQSASKLTGLKEK